MAIAFEIIGRTSGPVFMGELAGALKLGQGVGIAESCLLTEAGWTLFSFDMEQSEAVFLDIGPATDLSFVPFSYQLQYDCARRMVRLSFADVILLAKQIPLGKPQVHLFNMGHCGSTLLHSVFNRIGAAWCLSEPMFVFDLAMARSTVDEADRIALLRAGFAFLRLLPGLHPGQVQVIKHFSQAMTICWECHCATPTAQCLYLYREPESWCNSIYGFVQRMGGRPMVVGRAERAFQWWIMSGNTPSDWLDGLIDFASDVVTFDRMAAAAWALHHELFFKALAAGVPMLTTRYDRLVQDRAGAVARIFDHCGLVGEDLQPALSAFDFDSHEGTATAKSVPVKRFTKTEFARIRAVLSSSQSPLNSRALWPDARQHERNVGSA